MRLRGKGARAAPSLAGPRGSPSAGPFPIDASTEVTAVSWRSTESARIRMPDEFDRIAGLAALALGSRRASVTIADELGSVPPVCAASPTSPDPPSAIDRSLVQFVIDSARELIIDDVGDQRLGDLIRGLGELTAAEMAAAIIKTITAYSGGVVSDDTAVLVLKFP